MSRCRGRRPAGSRRGSSGGRRDRGMVTVELAVGLLTLAVVTLIGAFAVAAVVVQTRCGDTASAVARQLARGDAAGADRARATAPVGAVVHVTRSSGTVSVTVEATRYLGRLGPLRLSSRAEAALEPGVLP